VQILDYLGKPTKDGLVLSEGSVGEGISDFLRVSRLAYGDDLFKCVADELRLIGENRETLDPALMKRIRAGEIPTKEQFALRSEEFEEKLGSGFLITTDPDQNIVAACAICNPVDGYRYQAGIDENGDPVIDIWYGNWANQSHLWAAPVANERDNMNLSLANTLMGARLVERDGAERVTFFNSIYTPEEGPAYLMGRVGKTTDGQEYAAKFPMVDAKDKGTASPDGGKTYRLPNNGRLYMIDLTSPKSKAELRKIESEVISALWGE